MSVDDPTRQAVMALGQMGAITANAGFNIGNALMAVPVAGTPKPDEIRDFLRQFIAFDPAGDNPVPITCMAYLARIATQDRILEEAEKPEEVIAAVERWIAGVPSLGLVRTWSDVAGLLKDTLNLISSEIKLMTGMLQEMKEKLEGNGEPTSSGDEAGSV